jgi:hypothetical protein
MGSLLRAELLFSATIYTVAATVGSSHQHNDSFGVNHFLELQVQVYSTTTQSL